jgi:hypothetical protein
LDETKGIGPGSPLPSYSELHLHQEITVEFCKHGKSEEAEASLDVIRKAVERELRCKQAFCSHTGTNTCPATMVNSSVCTKRLYLAICACGSIKNNVRIGGTIGVRTSSRKPRCQLSQTTCMDSACCFASNVKGQNDNTIFRAGHVIFRCRLFHLPSIPWIPQGRRAPGGCGTGKDRLAHLVATRSDWRMLPFSLIVQVTLSNINGTLRVYS